MTTRANRALEPAPLEVAAIHPSSTSNDAMIEDSLTVDRAAPLSRGYSR
ncbi:hypothetical protein OB955_21950 [Halobacteria archaeon AArc-m2/3/4]|uniref:Uncharacterized protein n=1 Tax=Natronoglomus mannanivorans TaxID=2979990 RepID=A0ABT2QKC2_9EURY|nr:hypothetical protein [Halobacteria archaeon AArc-m2/3/4]